MWVYVSAVIERGKRRWGIPFLNTGKIYYNLCPSKRAECETKSKKEEVTRETEESIIVEREREPKWVGLKYMILKMQFW